MASVWTVGSGGSVGYPPLAGRLKVDVAVIGAGITGLTTALLLREAGLRVALLEAGRIGRGNTGGSTGNLYGTVSGGLAALRDRWNADTVRDVVALRMAALDLIEETVARHGIDCEFARRPLYRVVASDLRQVPGLVDEHEASREAGLDAHLLDAVPELPFPLRRAMRIDGQAQFNPLRYAQGLAAVLSQRGGAVHEGSTVISVDAAEGLVGTADGEVRADHIVFASHTPKGFNVVQAEMESWREYGVAAETGAAADGAEAILWINDESLSLRRYRHAGRRYAVAVGGKHKTGQAADGDPYQQLDAALRERFGIGDVSHRWSAQQYVPADGLPYIGRSANSNVFIATGFSADGLVWGTLAGQIIAGLVQDREPAGSELLTPWRFTPAKSARLWASENAEVVKHLVGDRLSGAELDRLDDLPPGEGRIVDIDGEKQAAYRAEDGRVTLLSPVCPHLKCHVAWNPLETSWDCPCHGSRFRTDGSVIEGPALQPLARRAAPD
jgi:glycine/D-amino acid oxidase-like deaminating enzyme/nitrite reductase/ring-hydroxylating ferredoxin subunit